MIVIYQLFLVRYSAVVNEHILWIALKCHVVYGQHKGTFTAFHKRQEVGAVVCWVENIVSAGT